MLKEFYLIECIDGWKTGQYVKKVLSYKILKKYLEEMKKVREKWDGKIDINDSNNQAHTEVKMTCL